MEIYREVSDEERTMEAAWQKNLRMPLLHGHLQLRNLPRLLPTSVRVYLSSIASDSECERQYLIDNVYIKLRVYCRAAHGIEFQAMIGQRYCNEAIPPAAICQNKFVAVKQVLQQNGHEVGLLDKYYKLDENVSPPCFLLQPWILANTDKWVETERQLSELLMQAHDYMKDADWSNPPSDLHTDMNAGLFMIEKQKFRDDNCIIVRKTITDLHKRLEKKRASRFIDIYAGTNQVDKEAEAALKTLNEAADSYLTSNNIFNFDIPWSEPAGISSLAHREYLDSLGSTLFEQIRRHVDVNMIEWSHYPNEELYVEVQQHWLETKSNLSEFYEQGKYIDAITKYISSQSSLPLLVHGPDGSGKSCILSHIATTLCEVIGKPYKLPKTFLEAKLMFRNILESGYCNCTLLLVIDGLDRLSTGGYDQIDWLPQKLSPNVKMVISMRDSDPRGTLTKIQSKYADSSCFLQVSNMLPETCEWIIQKRLQAADRSLTHAQWKVLLKCLHECPYPLYAQMCFQQVVKWRSFDHPYLPTTLPGLCERLLDILEIQHGKLVTSHILSMVTSSLYGLSEAELEDILSIDDELLSVFATSATRNHAVQRVPCLIWSRLKFDLQPYLSVWKVDGVNLVTHRYAALDEAVRTKYLSFAPFRVKIHSLLSDFFLGRWSGINKKPNEINLPRQEKTISSVIEQTVPEASNRNVISQPLVISGHGADARVNVRKLNELAHHLAKAERIDELKAKVLFSYDWLHTKLSAMPMARLLTDFDIYSDSEIYLVRQALAEIDTEFFPDTLGIELTGRLLPYYSQHPNIRSLIDQCDLAAMKRCSAVPKLQLYQSPGSFLQHEFAGHAEVAPTLQIFTLSRPDVTYFVEKDIKKSNTFLRNVQSFEVSRMPRLPGEGFVYVTPNQERIVAKRAKAIECYQVDSQQKEFYIATENGPISCAAISNTYFIFSIKQRTGPLVCDLKYPSLIHTFTHHSTAIAISDDSEIMVCNDGHSLYVYELPLMTRHCVISTGDIPNKILFLADPNKFCVLSASYSVCLFSVDRIRKTSVCTVIVQEPSLMDIRLSPDKSTLLLHSKSYVRLVSLPNTATLCSITSLSYQSSAHDIVAADFNFDGSKVVAARERIIGVFDAKTGAEICQAKVPYPCDIWSCLTCPKLNKAVSVLENGLIHVWDLDFAASSKKRQNNYYPGEVTSFSLSRDGARMAVCNKNYPEAQLVDCNTGHVIHKLYDSFSAGSQPLSVQISPCGQFVVTSCANDIEGTIDWCRLRSNYVWSSSACRVTHFFVNCYSVTFSTDDSVVVALSCVDYTPADPSNKFFVALCYQLQGKDVGEHKVTLPDGDIIGEPLVYSEKNWMVCLVQPCIKTKFSGLLTEQRVDNVQLYIFDIFTSSARDRKAVNCSDMTNEEKTFFINMRETDKNYQLMLIYARGKLPPYNEDGTVDIGHPMDKGMILYDLLTSTVLHHMSGYLDPTVPADRVLISKHLQYAMHDYVMYDGKSGVRTDSPTVRFQASSIAPVLLFDGNYMAVVNHCKSLIKIVNTRNGHEKSHFLLHGEAVDMQKATDDRTLYISTIDGRVLVMVVILELCDPVTMLIRTLPSRVASN
ncbi:NACHT and WD repeat domain-containing protein 2-like [Watersipora subatra]|uniref:NACHT and WD repeat domain-containing protein 2-like n=1 Tax=Watersipora subatra TaxID=2589382 RepID=UPI00355B91EC